MHQWQNILVVNATEIFLNTAVGKNISPNTVMPKIEGLDAPAIEFMTLCLSSIEILPPKEIVLEIDFSETLDFWHTKATLLLDYIDKQAKEGIAPKMTLESAKLYNCHQLEALNLGLPPAHLVKHNWDDFLTANTTIKYLKDTSIQGTLGARMNAIRGLHHEQIDLMHEFSLKRSDLDGFQWEQAHTAFYIQQYFRKTGANLDDIKGCPRYQILAMHTFNLNIEQTNGINWKDENIALRTLEYLRLKPPEVSSRVAIQNLANVESEQGLLSPLTSSQILDMLNLIKHPPENLTPLHFYLEPLTQLELDAFKQRVPYEFLLSKSFKRLRAHRLKLALNKFFTRFIKLTKVINTEDHKTHVSFTVSVEKHFSAISKQLKNASTCPEKLRLQIQKAKLSQSCKAFFKQQLNIDVTPKISYLENSGDITVSCFLLKPACDLLNEKFMRYEMAFPPEEKPLEATNT